MICSQMASTVRASAAVKNLQYGPPPVRPHDASTPAAVAVSPISRNLRRWMDFCLVRMDRVNREDLRKRRLRDGSRSRRSPSPRP